MNNVIEFNDGARSGARSFGPVRRPEDSAALGALAGLARSYWFEQIQDLLTNGGDNAIWGGIGFESPLIFASDTIPVGIDQLWAVESHRTEAIAENYFQVPPEFCSMIKTILGRLHLEKDRKIKRFLHFGSGCEPISSALDLAKRDGYDVFIVDTVSAFKAEEKREDLVAFLVYELERTALWLTGKPVNEDRLREEIKKKNSINKKVRRILDLRSKNPHYIPGLQTQLLFLGSFHYFGQPEKFIKILDDLIEELEEIALTPEPPTYVPLVIAGFIGNERLFQAIEESNGAVVGWVGPGKTDYREDVPPVESLAHFLLDAQSRGELGELVGASVAYRRLAVEEEVRKTGALGVVSSSITGCPYASLMQQLERDHFNALGIPLVTLETSIHKDPPTEEQITRIKAFVEMLT